MTRDEHRAKAERRIEHAGQESPDVAQMYLLEAITHALLALSAPDAEATAEQMVGRTVFTSGDGS